MKSWLSIVSIGLLTACGGGGGSDNGHTEPDQQPSHDVIQIPTLNEALTTQNIQVLSAENGQSGIYILSQEIALSGIDRGISHEKIYSGRVNGTVYGILTSEESVPLSATFSANSSASAAVQDGSLFYELSNGDVNVALNNGEITVLLSNFSGNSLDGHASSVSFNKGALDLNINWYAAGVSPLCGNSQFCGGIVTLSGQDAQYKIPSVDALVDAHGAFYGPKGEEIGGVILVEDTGRMSIQAGFLAHR